MTRIWLSPPDLRGNAGDLVLAALETGWVAPVGPDLDLFESELAARCGVPFAVGLSSGSAALHLALLGVGVGPGDDVLVPTLTFAASANPVLYCGARPCFLDVDSETWNLSAELLAAELAERQRRNKLPAAVLVVDLYGQCAAFEELLPLCSELGIPVIEDAAQAVGATWAEGLAGSFGHVAALSFNGNKIITTSGGGALLCHDEAIAERAHYLASQARQPVLHYEHTEVGFSYGLSNLLAALGRSQLATLDERIRRRREIRDAYTERFAGVPGVAVHQDDPRGHSNAWLSCITLEPGVAATNPMDLCDHLDAADVEARPLCKPMHAQPLFAQAPARVDGTADRLFATGVCLPSGSGMSDDDQDRVIELVLDKLAV
jgi:dTDP-4-amino-4,6-dideoxygalactose transaminase